MQIFADLMKQIARRTIAASAVLFAISGISAGTAQAADIMSGGEPPNAISAGICAHQRTLSQISYDFYQSTLHVPETPKIKVTGFSNIMATRDEPGITSYNISRYYCSATAHMNDGSTYPVWYVVQKRQGYAGIFENRVDSCFENFDRWRVHDGYCRTVR